MGRVVVGLYYEWEYVLFDDYVFFGVEFFDVF